MNKQVQSDVDVKLWLAPVPGACDAARLAAFEPLLSEEERGRWKRFHHAADRERFLIGRAFMRTVLADSLGHDDPATLQFARMPHGKPVLAGPHAHRLHYNLSHTDGMLVLAVCPRYAVGVDVEAVMRKVELLALAQRYFAANEYDDLQALDGAAQRERFFLLWTLKEAWLKASGLGLRIPLDDFSFRFDGTHPAIAFSPQLDEKPDQWQFRVFSPGEFRIALAVHCASALPLHVQIQQWSAPG